MENLPQRFKFPPKPTVPEWTCVLCDEISTTFGHSPSPLAEEGKCCDQCNRTKVYPARIAVIEKEDEEDVYSDTLSPCSEYSFRDIIKADGEEVGEFIRYGEIRNSTIVKIFGQLMSYNALKPLAQDPDETSYLLGKFERSETECTFTVLNDTTQRNRSSCIFFKGTFNRFAMVNMEPFITLERLKADLELAEDEERVEVERNAKIYDHYGNDELKSFREEIDEDTDKETFFKTLKDHILYSLLVMRFGEKEALHQMDDLWQDFSK